MPKMKTKSGAKKRFKILKSGLVRATQANKKHNMRTKSKRQLRNQRGSNILCKSEGIRAMAYFPYKKVRKNARKNCCIFVEA